MPCLLKDVFKPPHRVAVFSERTVQTEAHPFRQRRAIGTPEEHGVGFLGASADSVDCGNQDLNPLPPAIMSLLVVAVGGQEDQQQRRCLENLAKGDVGDEPEGLPLTQ